MEFVIAIHVNVENTRQHRTQVRPPVFYNLGSKLI